MKMPKPIRVKIYYDDNLKKITGREFEETVISENMDFRMLLHYIFSSYPAIPKKFIPATLGFSLNGKLPQSDTVLSDGDELRLAGYTIEKVREGIKEKIEKAIFRYGIDLDFNTIKQMIYEEKDQNDFNILTNFFAHKISDINELNEILRMVNAAWNCFPHECLGNISPMEKLAKSQQVNKN